MDQLSHRSIIQIEKEALGNIIFASQDVLEDPAKKRLREMYLQKAEKLGNAYKGKVKMIFQTLDEKILSVETTIWAADHNHITLKGGVHIPTRAILDVEFS